MRNIHTTLQLVQSKGQSAPKDDATSHAKSGRARAILYTIPAAPMQIKNALYDLGRGSCPGQCHCKLFTWHSAESSGHVRRKVGAMPCLFRYTARTACA